jgi:hypothetical protein
VHVSSGEESEAVTKEEDGSEDGFVTERKEPVLCRLAITSAGTSGEVGCSE